jgi:serine/threonine protein kinase
MRALSEVRHPNVASLLGICLRPPMLVMPFLAGGDLQSFIDQAAARVRAVHTAAAAAAFAAPAAARISSQSAIGSHPTDGAGAEGVAAAAILVVPSWAERLSLLLDVARGLAALHARHLLHCDLKPGNVLLQSVEPPPAPLTAPTLPTLPTVKSTVPAGPAPTDAVDHKAAADSKIATQPRFDGAMPCWTAVIGDFGLSLSTRATASGQSAAASSGAGTPNYSTFARHPCGYNLPA